jgi:hypothetical protein
MIQILDRRRLLLMAALLAAGSWAAEAQPRA